MFNRAQFVVIVLFFVFGMISSVYSQVFIEADFERLLSSHELAASYNPETGRFDGTPSEIIPVEQLKKSIAKLSDNIKKLEQKKVQLAQKLITTDLSEEHESKIWEKTSQAQQKIESKTEEINRKQALLNRRGIPPLTTVVDVIDQIYKDTRQAYLQNADSSSIILNKLPVFPVRPPQVNSDNSLKAFYFDPCSELLSQYIRQAPKTGRLFRGLNQTILYTGASE